MGPGCIREEEGRRRKNSSFGKLVASPPNKYWIKIGLPGPDGAAQWRRKKGKRK